MISEKSLELNVLENIIRTLRNMHPKVFAYGFTLRQEFSRGLDVSINLPNNLCMFGLQFKKPKKSNNGMYNFKINSNKTRDQHLKLYYSSLSLNKKWGTSSIYYIFPAFSNVDELAMNSPNFLNRSFFIDPVNMPPQILDRNVHNVEIDENTGNAKVHSKLFKLEVLRGGDFIKQFLEKRSYLKISDLKEKKGSYLDKIINEDKEIYTKLSELSKTNWRIRLNGIFFKD